MIDDAKTGADPTVKLFLFTADEALDPFSDKAIKAANPAFGDFLNATEVRAQAETARRMPSAEAGYRNLILNQRVNQVSPLIARAVWESCAGKPDPETLRRCRVWVALDLSARNDMTALCMVALDENGVFHVWVEYFAPSAGVHERSKRDRVPYDLWARDGLITLTPGASIEYGFVCVRLIEICNDCDVQSIVYDRWRIDILKAELARLGAELPLIEWGQGFRDMSPAIDALESALLNGKIRHGSNPVLNWNAANAIATAKKSLVATTQIAITPQISLELAADDRSNFMAQMALWLGRANAQADTRDFTIGDGTGEPQGIINVTGRDIGMVSTTLTYDDIVNMIHGVGQQYRSLPKVAFAFNNSGIAKVRKIKDDNGRPILVEGTGPGLPARIFGYPVLELPDLPGDGSNATNETSGYFGCWELFYWWGDRQLLQIASDVSGTNFLANSMQLRSTTRSDGRIVLTDAIVRIVGVK
jgi:hypothetical protein